MLTRVDPASAEAQLNPPWRGGPRHPRARHLVHVFPSFDIGGAQVRFAALVKAFGDRYFHSVISLTNAFSAAALLEPGASVDLVPAPARGGHALQRLRAYRAELARLKPDLLLTYNWGSVEFALANLGGGPHMHMEDGFGPEETHRQIPRRVWTRRLALARSTVVVPSETLLRLATERWRLSARRVRHIPNAVAPKSRYATPLKDLGLDLPPGRARIAWAGALRPEKNPVRLLQAFAPLRDQASLIVIGDGPQRAAVQAEAERLGLGASLRLTGGRKDSRDLIMQCDVLALSSDTEQMPLVVLEAMDAGLPVASVDVGDVRRMVAEENRPFVTPVDAGALGEALARLVASPETRRRIGEANRRRAHSVYTVPRMAGAYDRLIQDLVSQEVGHG
jgi:glycosyltransferase involved in cell wall biosynthesis